MNDWIKMRGGLFDNPKVIAMARSLAADPSFAAFLVEPRASLAGGEVQGIVTGRHEASRYVTVAALLRVWSTCRAFGKFDGDDLLLPVSSTSDVDQMAGITGFGELMKKVGWLENGNGLRFPRFKEFNVPTTEAERAQAYRDRKRAKAVDKKDEPAVTARHGSSRQKRERREEAPAPKGAGSSSGGVDSPEQPQPSPRAREAAPDADLQAACRATWDRYKASYRLRWGTEPVRNAQVNSLIKQFCRLVPMAEAPDIAAFYCAHPKAFYVQNHHPLNILVRDAAGLRTEWATGHLVTGVSAAQLERSAARGQVFGKLIDEAEEREGHGTGGQG